MRELQGHPAFKTENLTQVINSLEIPTALYRGQEFCPVVESDSDQIMWDIRKPSGGMTQPVARGAESPTWRQFGAATKSLTPVDWREKVLLDERDFRGIRKLGTANDEVKLEELVAEVMGKLRTRLEARFEYLRWKMVFGSIGINENGVNFSVDYGIPQRNFVTPSGPDLWSSTETSDPIKQIQDILLLYRGSGYDGNLIWLNKNIVKLLIQNKRFRELMQGIIQFERGVIPTMESLGRVVVGLIGKPLTVYDQGIHLTTTLRQSASIASGQLVLESTTGFEKGDVITLVSPDEMISERVVIDENVAPGTHVISIENNKPDKAYLIGSDARVYKPLLPDNRVVIMGELPPAAEGGPNWSQMVLVRSVYNGGLFNPKPGMFARTDDHQDEDPPNISVLGGGNGLPAHYRPDINYLLKVY